MNSSILLPKNSAPFSGSPTFLVDTDVLSDIAKGGEGKFVETELLNRKITLLYSVTSIMELGFGPEGLVPEEEIKFYRKLYSFINPEQQKDIFATDYRIKRKSEPVKSLLGGWISISPDSHNWFAAKNGLITLMTHSLKKPKNAKQLQIDMLLNCTAWNAGAFIWSNNIRDHLTAQYYINYNYFAKGKNQSFDSIQTLLANNFVPVFNTELLKRVILNETLNIYSELKRKTKDKNILRVLEICERIYR